MSWEPTGCRNSACTHPDCTAARQQYKRENVLGVIYLLHFDQPYKHARHYLGWARRPADRLRHHANGTGARLTAVLREHGIGWTCVRRWRGTRADELRIKNGSHVPEYCPLCTPKVRIASGLIEMRVGNAPRSSPLERTLKGENSHA